MALAAGTFIVLGAEHYAPWAWVLYLALFVASPVFFTWIGRVIAAAAREGGRGRTVGGPERRAPGERTPRAA